jgi:SH3-like domain-containing protein
MMQPPQPAVASPAARRRCLPVSLAVSLPVSAAIALAGLVAVVAVPARAQTGTGSGTQTGTGTAAETPAKTASPATRRETHEPARQPAHAATPVVRAHGPTHALKPRGVEHAKPAPPAAAAVPVPQAAAPTVPEAAAKGSVTGFPLPRFASLRTDEVNLRRGPGTRYPIDWVYKRRDLPVEIEREFEVWRLIVDPDGTRGWVHEATLTGRRSVIVTDKEQVLRHDAADTAAAVARLEPGVIAHLRACAAGSDWCQVQIGAYRGYLRRDQFWGTLPDEVVGD